MDTAVPAAGRRLVGSASRYATVPLVALHVVVATVLFLGPPDRGDVHRFQQIAATAGRPYRDFAVEYAPLELAAIDAVAGATAGSTFRRVVLAALALDLATWAILASFWGRRSGVQYLLLGVPVLYLLYARLDLLPTLLALIATALAKRGRDKAGGVALAAAALVKLWPAAIAPLFIVGRRPRAALWFGVAAAAGVGVWLAYGGLGAPRQVTSFRGATGWQVESTVGAVVWILTGGPVTQQQGAARIGAVPSWAHVALVVALPTLLLASWWRARRWPGAPEGVPSLVAVAIVLVLSPLFSLQYAVWLLPWVAVLSTRDEREQPFLTLGAAAIVLTGAVTQMYLWARWDSIIPVIQGAVLARNVACAALVVLWFLPWKAQRSVPSRSV